MINFIYTQNMSQNFFQVQFKISRNHPTKLCEFVFACAKISRIFHGFMHIRNSILQNMDNIHYFENQNVNLWNLDIQNLNL